MKLTYCGPVNSTGYGNASLRYIQEFSRHVDELFVYPIAGLDKSLLPKLDLHNITFLDSVEEAPEAPSFTFWHALGNMLEYIPPRSTFKIGYSTFEIPLEESQRVIVDSFDMFGTATNYWTNTLLDGKYKAKIFTLYHVVKPCKIYSSKKIAQNLILFSSGKHEFRKNIDNLIKAVSKLNNITLYGHWNNYFFPDALPMASVLKEGYIPQYEGLFNPRKNRFKNRNSIENILYLSKPVEDMDLLLSELYSIIDVYISVALSEGWDLPLTDAMSAGIPCIISNCTSHIDFINILRRIDPELTELITVNPSENVEATDGRFFNSNFKWSKCSVDSIVDSILRIKSLRNKDMEDLSDLMVLGASELECQKNSQVQLLLRELEKQKTK